MVAEMSWHKLRSNGKLRVQGPIYRICSPVCLFEQKIWLDLRSHGDLKAPVFLSADEQHVAGMMNALRLLPHSSGGSCFSCHLNVIFDIWLSRLDFMGSLCNSPCPEDTFYMSPRAVFHFYMCLNYLFHSSSSVYITFLCYDWISSVFRPQIDPDWSKNVNYTMLAGSMPDQIMYKIPIPCRHEFLFFFLPSMSL